MTFHNYCDKYFLPTYVGLALIILPLTLGTMIYDRITADKIVNVQNQTIYGQNQTIYGYDVNNDNVLDKIKVYFPIMGARMAAPMRRTYTSKDKEFENLKTLFLSDSLKGNFHERIKR
jgi:hypothetical protein